MREPSLYITYSLFIRLLRRQVWAQGSYPYTSAPAFEPPVSERNDYLYLPPTIQKELISYINFFKVIALGYLDVDLVLYPYY